MYVYLLVFRTFAGKLEFRVVDVTDDPTSESSHDHVMLYVLNADVRGLEVGFATLSRVVDNVRTNTGVR